jgi:hypothetical protein
MARQGRGGPCGSGGEQRRRWSMTVAGTQNECVAVSEEACCVRTRVSIFFNTVATYITLYLLHKPSKLLNLQVVFF